MLWGCACTASSLSITTGPQHFLFFSSLKIIHSPPSLSRSPLPYSMLGQSLFFISFLFFFFFLFLPWKKKKTKRIGVGRVDVIVCLCCSLSYLWVFSGFYYPLPALATGKLMLGLVANSPRLSLSLPFSIILLLLYYQDADIVHIQPRIFVCIGIETVAYWGGLPSLLSFSAGEKDINTSYVLQVCVPPETDHLCL